MVSIHSCLQNYHKIVIILQFFYPIEQLALTKRVILDFSGLLGMYDTDMS